MVEYEEEAYWFLSIGVDMWLVVVCVMESRFVVVCVEEEWLCEFVIEVEVVM